MGKKFFKVVCQLLYTLLSQFQRNSVPDGESMAEVMVMGTCVQRSSNLDRPGSKESRGRTSCDYNIQQLNPSELLLLTSPYLLEAQLPSNSCHELGIGGFKKYEPARSSLDSSCNCWKHILYISKHLITFSNIIC